MPNLQPGDFVVLLSVPATLMSGLPDEDRVAIQETIGKTVRFSGMTYGQAELEFRDSHGNGHTIWVDTDHIRPA